MSRSAGSDSCSQAASDLLASHLGDPVPERGGRAKLHYTLTRHGRALPTTECAALPRLWTGLNHEHA